jgi:hypothetical protein
MNNEPVNRLPTIYEPRLATRLAWWFGIYFAAYLFLLWCWPGEIYDWTSPFDVPEGLLWLFFGVTGQFEQFGRKAESYGDFVLFCSYGFYLLTLVLSLTLRNKRLFWFLMIVFFVVACLSTYGTRQYGRRNYRYDRAGFPLVIWERAIIEFATMAISIKL